MNETDEHLVHHALTDLAEYMLGPHSTWITRRAARVVLAYRDAYHPGENN